jgi:hypothetical protein
VPGAPDANDEEGPAGAIVTADARSADAESLAAAPASMCLSRRGRGTHRVTVWLDRTGIDALIRKHLLPQERRHDRNAVRTALVDLLMRALGEPCDA